MDNLKLAKMLGFGEESETFEQCYLTYDRNGEPHYRWNGLEIPSSYVETHNIIVTYDPCTSGRYPWYIELMKEKGIRFEDVPE